MNKFIIGLFFLLLPATIFFNSCGTSSITPEVIEKDIVGRKMGGFWDGWRFSDKEPRDIQILKEGYDDKEAIIIINIKTRNGGPSGAKFSGKIRLKYEWIGNDWDLIKIENLTFGRD